MANNSIKLTDWFFKLKWPKKNKEGKENTFADFPISIAKKASRRDMGAGMELPGKYFTSEDYIEIPFIDFGIAGDSIEEVVSGFNEKIEEYCFELLWNFCEKFKMKESIERSFICPGFDFYDEDIVFYEKDKKVLATKQKHIDSASFLMPYTKFLEIFEDPTSLINRKKTYFGAWRMGLGYINLDSVVGVIYE